MKREAIEEHLSGLEGSEGSYPFGPEALVFKVMGKMFALIAWDETPHRISLKCDPDRALEIRAVFEGVRGAYHFNKRHWNMVDLDGSVPEEEVIAMIDHSFQLVVSKLPKAKRDEILK